MDKIIPRRARIIGQYSGRAFDESKIGLPIEKLNIADVQITSNGINEVVKHLRRFTFDGELDQPEQIMIDRLVGIVQGEIEQTKQDLHFYAHELREFARYKALGFEFGKGNDYELWNNLHTATLEEYQLKEGKKGDIFNNPLYHYEAAKYLPL